MTYASILTYVETGAEGAARLHIARDLSDSFNATLIGVAARAIPPAPFVDPNGLMAGEWVVAMRETLEEELKKARAAFKAASSNLSRKPIFKCGLQQPTEALSIEARSADIVVVGPAGDHADSFGSVSPGDLVVRAGRPVLVTPAGATAFMPRRIMVAWKDTREARRAIADALPLLERAEEVLVAGVCHPNDMEEVKVEVDDVTAALERHGVHARGEVVAHEFADGHQVLRKASLFGADLIVAGAYGHSRLGEWIFGGVTRELLSRSDQFILLSH